MSGMMTIIVGVVGTIGGVVIVIAIAISIKWYGFFLNSTSTTKLTYTLLINSRSY